MVYLPELVSGIGALLFVVIGGVVGMLGPEINAPIWRFFGARTVPLSRFASVGLGLMGGFTAGILTCFFATGGTMFALTWWGLLLAGGNAHGLVFLGSLIASVPARNAGY